MNGHKWTPQTRATPTPAPIHFGSWDGAVLLQSAKLLERLASDCLTVFSARAATSASEHSTGTTYWLPLGSKPRCLLEQLVSAILQAHLPQQYTGKENSSIGAEWWTLAIDAAEASIGFHWDLDYDAEENYKIHRTPYVGTVTYLCDTGAPTLIVEKAPTWGSRDGPPEDGKVIERGWLSAPAPGKHIRFRGEWLHGAPDIPVVVDDDNEPKQPSRKGGEKRGKVAPQKTKGNKRKRRTSLLVNLWLDGAPGLAAPLPQSVAERLSPCLTRVPFSLDRPSPMQASTKNGRREFTWQVANFAEGVDCELFVQIPRSVRMVPGGTVSLSFVPGEAMLIC